jgi:hypothetical protein
MRCLLAFVALALLGCEPVVLPTAEGEHGEPGPAGQDGRDGERGPAGPAWRPRTHIVQEFVDVEPGQWDTAQAFCDDGAMALHGGCQWGDWRGDHVPMRPMLATGIGQGTLKDGFEGWQCQGANEGEVPTRIYVTVTCLEIDATETE